MGAAAETARLVAELSLDAKKFTAGFKQATASVDKLEKKFGKLPGIASRGAAAAGRNIERGITIGAAAAAGATVWAVNAAIDWESAMAGVNKTIEATPAELAAIEKGLIGISNRTPIAATDLAAIAEAAGALGIAKDDILAFTETVAIIGSTTNVTTDEAATSLGQLGNVLKLTGEDYDNFAAALVDLGNKGASTEAQILEITKRAGAAATLFGLAKDETLGWAAAAANLGMNEELAGTSLQNLFLKSMNNFARGENKMADFMGMTNKAMKQAFGKDASGMLASFIKRLANLPKDARLEAVQSFFGKGSGLNRLVLGLAESMDKNLTPSLETSAEAWEANTAATAEAEKRFKTTESQLAILKNNVTNAATTIGTNLLPLVNELASEMTGWISTHQDEIKQFGQDLARGIREAVKWAKSLDWDKITSSLQAGARFAKGLIDAFLAAPPWVQTFLATGFVANKFTGGAISGIIGELGKGLIKGMLGITAGTVIVKGPVVGGGTGGGIGGGKGGALGKLGGLLSVATIVGSAIAVWETQQSISDESTAQANAIKEGLDKTLSVKTPEQLQTALNGVNQGIKDLKSNPLNVLVQGDALATLQQMADDLRGQQEKNALINFRKGERDSREKTPADKLNEKLNKLKQQPRTDKLEAKVKELAKGLRMADPKNPTGDTRKALKDAIAPLAGDTRSEGLATRRALATGSAQSIAAFRSAERTFANQKPPTVTVGAVTVAVSIGAANVNKSVTVRRRYGTTGGSRDVESGHGK